MEKPTQKIIQKNIAWLEANIKNLPMSNAFGENIQLKAKADLVVLKEDLSEDEINERSQFEDDESTMENEWDQGQRESAEFTRQWMDGQEEMSPIDNYKGLVGKTFNRMAPPE